MHADVIRIEGLKRALRRWRTVDIVLAVALICIMTLCAFGVFGCFFAPAIPSVYEINETTNCISDGCRDFVGRFYDTIQPDVDPCQDFYAHVCGGWINTTDIPSDAVGIDVLSEAQMALNLEVMDKLNHTVISYRNQNAQQKAAAFYLGCLNMELRNSKGTKPLEKLLARLGIPHWPIVESNFQADVMGILANVTREIGVGALLSLRVGPDQTNNRRNVIYLDQPSFGVEHAILRARYRTPYFRILHRYKLYAYRCALLLGATVAAADLVNEIVGFEIRLAQIADEKEDVENSKRTYETISLDSLEMAIPLIKWTFFLNRVLRDVPVMLDLTDKVMLRNQHYLRALSQLLQEESTYVVVNYLGWRVVQLMAPFTIERMRMAQFRFDRYRYSLHQVSPLSHHCYALAARYMGFALGRLLYDRDKQRPFDRRDKIQRMADELKSAFSILMDIADWMNRTIRDISQYKLSEMKINPGFPLWIKSDGDLNEHYKDIPDLRKEDFFVSSLLVIKAFIRNGLMKLKYYGHDKDYGWLETQPQVDPVYQYLGNFILLPEAYAQEPFFRMTASPSVNFGALGSVLGRYITHGFTIQGSHYNYRGDREEVWTPATRRRYVQLARCFKIQIDFPNPFTGEEINSTLYRDSLVADNAAVKEAFKAYRIFATRYEELYRLIIIQGLETYNQDQIFFISYAMTMCEKLRRHSLYHYLRPKSGISNHNRTNLSLMNFERFGFAFNCPLGSPMNPELKCDVY